MNERNHLSSVPTLGTYKDKGLATGGSGPHDPDMLARIAQLEQHCSDLRVDVATIKERLNHVATKAWIMGGVVIVLLGILGGVWWMAQQYLGPILQHLGK
ncbi:hypothetical protein [Rhodanobacter sp. C05]|uniref:hypothetical protein n=1 Tax=Rhodanobacter sp. C05 TaxID=1945855 RepID=UPI0009871C02|nr:hypothetical protein [Rhodanobacter sp. C05]